MQCYAVLKLILKEFIKIKCSPNHKDVLCSYFIKTFLFWQFEAKESSFWQTRNLISCLMYLLNEFYNCIHNGVLRHHFIPHFNLLEIKLNPSAQAELLHLFGHAIQRGLSILGECGSLSRVWLDFIHAPLPMHLLRRLCILDNDEFLMYELTFSLDVRMFPSPNNPQPYARMLLRVESHLREGYICTALMPLAIRRLCFRITKERLYDYSLQNNKDKYKHLKCLDTNIFGIDIGSCKLLLATFLLHKGDLSGTLKRVHDVLSAIPPYALYYSTPLRSGKDAKRMFLDTYSDSDALSRAREAWVLDIYIEYWEHPFMPRAIQIELEHQDRKVPVMISSYTYAYYLMFVCYHGLGQYDNRDRALRQLVDTVHDEERSSGVKYFSYNITGNCLLMAGKLEMARDLFLKSTVETKQSKRSAHDKYNSAYYYLSLM